MFGHEKHVSGLTIKSLLLLLLLTVLFFWKILLTHQYSILVGEEGVRQWYSWLNFSVLSLKQSTLPLWDPYTGAGTSFSGEMQTGAFYPLNLLLALVPLNRNGMLSPQLFHQFYALIHFLGGCFMFALVRELGLSRFSALIAGICFSLGGFLIQSPWGHLYRSAIWLPLILLFLMRALASPSLKKVLLYASMSGLMLGIAILGGGLHVVVLQVLVVITFAVFAAFHPQMQAEKFRNRPLITPLLAGAAVLAVGFCAGAIQLFPSMEYSGQALRWIGHNAPALPANSKIPYAYLKDFLNPNAFLGMMIPTALDGVGEKINPYIGVFPFLAAIIGVMKCWNSLWVRYLTGLAVVSFLYTLGERSLLHGVLYAVIPRLWMAREADRFIYLASFALPILAAFGVETLLCKPFQKPVWHSLNRVLTGIVVACAAALIASAFFWHQVINPWVSFSILMVLASYGLFQYIIRGGTGMQARALIVTLVLFDLSAFDWIPRNKIEEAQVGHVNHLDRLMSCRGAVNFLKSRAVPFRVKIDDDPKPNIGDAFQVPIISNTGVTALKDYDALGKRLINLLNVRYILKPSSVQTPGALYEDEAWKVYQNSMVYPAAWVVHQTTIEPSIQHLLMQMDSQDIDFHQTAVLSAPLEVPLEPEISGIPEKIVFIAYEADSLELEVQAQSRGLLVLSEIYYPGWRAAVNGKSERIHKVNGILRGVVVPGGRSHVVLEYAPLSVRAGGLLGLSALSLTLVAFVVHRRKSDSS
jgi:hypothetical protein